MRKICLAYWLLLTLLLLASNPGAWFGFEHTADSLLERYQDWSHLVCFTVLSTLVFIARWPVSRGWLALLLVAYSAGTELLQRLVPSRQAEWKDFWQDVAGVALGAIVAWCVRRLWRMRHESRQAGRTANDESLQWQRPRRRAAPMASGAPPE